MRTPSDWFLPTFLMNFPLSVSNEEPNNPWMVPSSQGKYIKTRACKQWLELYQHLVASGSLVYVLPGHNDLQDLPFVANLGAYLPHLQENVVILANFASKPRVGETPIGRKFFESFDYQVVKSPFCWEGEADLKWVRDNIYVGAVGSRSTAEAYKWMRNAFDMKIIEIELKDPKLYHLDCVFFPLTETKALVNSYALHSDDIVKLKKVVEILGVPSDYVYQGWTNCVRVKDEILHAPADLPWQPFADYLAKHNFSLKTFDLTEFDKSGADLSCLCMHLNFKNLT